MKAFARTAAGVFCLGGFGCLLKVGIGLDCDGEDGPTSGPLLDRNLPIGDSDLILNLDDLTPSGVGKGGRIDLRITGDEEPGGDIGPTCLGVEAAARTVGAGSCLIDPRIVIRPPRLRLCARVRWKLLADASESLSYGGTVAVDFLIGGMLCGRAFGVAGAV